MFKIPTITKNLLIINVLAFVAMYALRGVGIDMNSLCGLHFFLASDFHVYQLITYMFMHANFEHIFFNMFMLWMFGVVLERVWGPKKFLFYYISCGIGAGLLQELAQLVQFYFIVTSASPSASISDVFAVASAYSSALNGWSTVGASGAIYSLLLAFGMLFPNERMFIFPIPIPIKAKWMVIGSIVLELASALATPGDHVAHLAHLGGMLFGFLMIRYWQKHPGSGYNIGSGQQFFQNLKNQWESHRSNRGGRSWNAGKRSGNSDWDYNERKHEDEKEVDRILDKIRRSGYDSLTTEEKQKLFDQKK